MRQIRARNKDDKESRRNVVMDTAIELYLSNNAKLPKASEIARASGMTKGNLYTYFKSKEELYFEILIQQYDDWLDQTLAFYSYASHLETRLFEGFYRNELLVKLNTLYHSSLKHNLDEARKKEFEKLIRNKLDLLSIPISEISKKSKGEIQILLYSSISLIVGAYQFQSEFHEGYDFITPEDIYLPRLKVMWSIF